MEDKLKIKLADKILAYIDELQGSEDEDELMEDEDIFKEPKGPKIILKIGPKKGK